VNLLFYRSFCWKWPWSCHVLANWPIHKSKVVGPRCFTAMPCMFILCLNTLYTRSLHV